MRIILDSNEFILGLDTAAGPSASSRLLDLVRILIDESDNFRLLVPEIIVREVQKNLPPDLEKDFFRLQISSPSPRRISWISLKNEEKKGQILKDCHGRTPNPVPFAGFRLPPE